MMVALVLGCLLVVGAAAASILTRDRVTALRAEGSNLAVAGAANGTSSNKQAKADRLAVTALAAVASRPGPLPGLPPQGTQPTEEPLRQAFAADSPVEAVAPDVTAAVAIPPLNPKLAAKPPVQKTYALLSDAQIAAIKGRLNLSADQESYWPAVEDALHRVAKKIHEKRQAKATAGPPIDPDSAEVQQLKSAAMPLLFQLREDQKREVRSLARMIGLEAVASAI